MTLVIPHSTANQTAADGQKVGENFASIASYVNQEMVHRNGSVAMTGPLLLPGDPTAPNHAARKGYVDLVVPPGAMMLFGGSSAPAGWALCDGGLYSKTGFPLTFAAIGTAYGESGDGTQFRVPNLQNRVPVGKGGSPFGTLGNTGGNKDQGVPSHKHGMGHGHGNNISASMSGHNHGVTGTNVQSFLTRMTAFAGAAVRLLFSTVDGEQPSGSSEMAVAFSELTGSRNPSISVSGGVTDHSGDTATEGDSATNMNLQPYLVLNYIIRMA